MKNKKIIFIVVGVLILLVVGVLMVFNSKKTDSDTELKSTLPISQNYQKIPEKITVDVELIKNNKWVNFKVSDIPAKYKTIEYEFSYKTSSGGLQGGIGSPSTIKNGQYQKEILLGTCSAGGACTYDEGVEKIKFTIFLSTLTDKRYYEKEFSLN